MNKFGGVFERKYFVGYYGQIFGVVKGKENAYKTK